MPCWAESRSTLSYTGRERVPALEGRMRFLLDYSSRLKFSHWFNQYFILEHVRSLCWVLGIQWWTIRHCTCHEEISFALFVFILVGFYWGLYVQWIFWHSWRHNDPSLLTEKMSSLDSVSDCLLLCPSFTPTPVIILCSPHEAPLPFQSDSFLQASTTPSCAWPQICYLFWVLLQQLTLPVSYLLMASGRLTSSSKSGLLNLSSLSCLSAPDSSPSIPLHPFSCIPGLFLSVLRLNT